MDITTRNSAEYSDWFGTILEQVDPDCYYRDNFNSGFFVNSSTRIAVGYVPSGFLDRLWSTVDGCVAATDPMFPLDTIRTLIGWDETLQSVTQEYLRASGNYPSIENSFLDSMVLTTGVCIRDLFLRYPVLHETVQNIGVCGSTVRIMHLLWMMRGLAQKCDVIVRNSCIGHQIKTAKERLDVRDHFDL